MASVSTARIELFGWWNDEPEPSPHWVERPDGRKVLHLWPEAGANSYANDDKLIASRDQSPDPALAEIVRFLARRAARQWFARAGGE